MLLPNPFPIDEETKKRLMELTRDIQEASQSMVRLESQRDEVVHSKKESERRIFSTERELVGLQVRRMKNCIYWARAFFLSLSFSLLCILVVSAFSTSFSGSIIIWEYKKHPEVPVLRQESDSCII